jgi:hypothetical protein
MNHQDGPCCRFAGARPFWRKVTAWHARTLESRADPLTAELARAYVAGLLSGIPQKRRADAERRVLALVSDLYREAGTRPPG